MTYSIKALRFSTLSQLLRSWFEKNPARLAMVAALLALGACRLLPVSWLAGLDHLLGRPGDALLMLAVLLLVAAASIRLRLHPLSQLAPSQGLATVAAVLDQHLRLDAKIEQQLIEVVGDTEDASLAIMQQVRNLYDTASKLVAYLDISEVGAELGTDIQSSVSELVKIGSFIETLPIKMARDLENLQSIVKEIKEITGLLGEVQAISMQSLILAINTAIEASRAGASGASFRVISQEMRSLAANSASLAARIAQGLARARHVIEDGIASGILESTVQMEAAAHASSSIQTSIDYFEEMIQYYKTRFAVVTQHNLTLAEDIAAVMSHSQYQDVARQCIERARVAMGQRNAFFQHAVNAMECDGADATQLTCMLEQIVIDYDTEEGMHGHSERHVGESSSEPKIELF